MIFFHWCIGLTVRLLLERVAYRANVHVFCIASLTSDMELNLLRVLVVSPKWVKQMNASKQHIRLMTRFVWSAE